MLFSSSFGALTIMGSAAARSKGPALPDVGNKPSCRATEAAGGSARAEVAENLLGKLGKQEGHAGLFSFYY
jgi:hypothetical protein